MSRAVPTRWDVSSSTALPASDLTITRQVAVIGAGGHGMETADIVRAASALDDGLQLYGIADDGSPDRELIGRMGFRFLGSARDVLARPEVELLLGIGDPAIRAHLDAGAPHRASAAVAHPTASVGSFCSLAPGVVLAQGVIITTNVHLGRHTHVNVGASVSHDCRVGDHVTICPGVRVTGGATIGARAFIGTSASILPGVSIGDDAVIGAGAVVCRDVPSGSTVRGVPAR